jgi:hypothetical protein
MSEEELSITLYHEVLEAATVSCANPPASVVDLSMRVGLSRLRGMRTNDGVTFRPGAWIGCCNFTDLIKNGANG